MRQRGSSDDAVEVEIVEVDDPAGLDHGAPVDAPDDADPRDHARRRVLRRVGLGVIAALTAAVVVVNVADARARSERRAELAGFPSILGELTGPLTEAWSIPGAWITQVGDEVIVVQDPSTGRLSGVRPEDGQVLWTRERGDVFDAYCAPAGIPYYSGSTIPTAPRENEMLCVRTETLYGEVPAPGDVSTLTTLDIATGAELQTLEVSGGLLFWFEFGGDLVVTFAQPDGRLGVVRWDPDTGRQAWAYHTEVAAGAEGWPAVSMEQSDDTLRVGTEPPVTISLESGQEVASEAEPDEGFMPPFRSDVALADGASVVSELDPGTGQETVSVVAPDGSVRFTVPGTLWRADAWDQTDRGIVLVLSNVTTAASGVDAVTGEVLWSVEGMSAFVPVSRVDGVVVVAAWSMAVAISVDDGSVLWRVPLEGALLGGLTDGDVVLLPGVVDDEPRLIAYDVTTGTREWDAAVPSGASRATAVAGLVVFESEAGVSAFH